MGALHDFALPLPKRVFLYFVSYEQLTSLFQIVDIHQSGMALLLVPQTSYGARQKGPEKIPNSAGEEK
jgi:hypothetical protein